MTTDGFALYHPGDQVAVVLGATAILLPGSPGDALPAECFAALATNGVEAAIDALFARGLRAAPDFAICEIDGSGRARALTRGRGRVEIETARDRHVLDEGRLVADHEYTDVVIATLALALGPAAPAVPVQGGVVAASAVSVTPVIAASLSSQTDDVVPPLAPVAVAESTVAESTVAEPPADAFPIAVSDPGWVLADPVDSPGSVDSADPVDSPGSVDSAAPADPAAPVEKVENASDGPAEATPDDERAAETRVPADTDEAAQRNGDESTPDPAPEHRDTAFSWPDAWSASSDDSGAAAPEPGVGLRPIDLSKFTSRSAPVGEDPLESPAPIEPNDAIAPVEPATPSEPDDAAVDLAQWGWGGPSAPASSADVESDSVDDGFVHDGPSWNPADWRVTPAAPGESAEPVDVFDSQPSFAFPPPPGTSGLQGPDPDGDMELTIARGDLMAALDASATPPSCPLVLAKRCAQGHVTVAFQPTCRVCHGPVPEQEAVEISRPPLGILRLESGEVITVDRDIVLGRSPREIPGQQGERPHLARIVDPQHEVSGQHALVSVNYWLVSVTDLGSTNGTEVVDAHGVSTALTPDTPVVIEPGSTIVLGEVSRISFEATA